MSIVTILALCIQMIYRLIKHYYLSMTFYFSFLDKKSIEMSSAMLTQRLRFGRQSLKDQIEQVNLWIVEFETSEIIREVALDIDGNIIYYSPQSDLDLGFWRDSKIKLSQLSDFEPTFLKREDFAVHWNKCINNPSQRKTE